MAVQSPPPILVDTSALIAICKTNYDERIYSTLQMATTNVCNDEVKRQKDQRDDLVHKNACRRYLELLREEKNPDVIPIEEYKPYVDDQGEKTLEQVFRSFPSDIKFILLFDFDAIEKFESVKQELGGDALNTRISLPNYAFELLRTRGPMDKSEYCKATYQMGVEEDWLDEHALKLDEVSPVDCPKFP
ncbi:hypothetical protein [Halobacterium salinarum]|uniref:hypothetical protein n=1 Tax=Halobacterium salinarum TaxID=2242 RepID=UPI0025579785|nr:hypothetical protein [Halobacterium salinarum]MDL0134580.1 hypothetical protein [Halobacterium salinarum]